MTRLRKKLKKCATFNVYTNQRGAVVNIKLLVYFYFFWDTVYVLWVHIILIIISAPACLEKN